MKTRFAYLIIIVFGILYLFSPYANAQMTMKEFTFESCKGMSEMADVFLRNRNSGISYSAQYQNLDKHSKNRTSNAMVQANFDFNVVLLGDVYRLPLFSTQQNQITQRRQFTDRFMMACMDGDFPNVLMNNYFAIKKQRGEKDL